MSQHDQYPDDLQQIFGYQGAVDEREGLRELGSEVYAVPFWTPPFCSTVIRAAEAVGAFVPHDDDPVPGHEVSLAVVEGQLRSSGFKILSRNDSFIERPADETWWLLSAKKP